MRRFLILILLLALGLTACGSTDPQPVTSPQPAASPTVPIIRPSVTPYPTATDPGPVKLWLSPALPDSVTDSVQVGEGVTVVSERAAASWLLEIDPHNRAKNRWVYTLAAPFPSLLHEVTTEQIRAVWAGNPLPGFPDRPLLLSEPALLAFSVLWGEPGVGAVQLVEPEALLAAAWEEPYSLALVPFEQLDPRWQVLRVDDSSPFDRDFTPWAYPLTIAYNLVGVGPTPPVEFAPTNYDPQQMTTLLLTGTTALVRNTAARMVENGVDYPAGGLLPVFRSVDFLHISNEVPFYTQCPPALPVRKEMRFCADPTFLQLLETIGADVIELTGNHVLDWGQPAFAETLALYQQAGLPYYGGGTNADEAAQPFQIEHHGNRIALLGCNLAGPENVWATATRAGAARCDLDQLETQVRTLRAEGYLPVVTFQHYEVDELKVSSAQRVDFARISAAGAVIVSGSQAHFPQGFALSEAAFIHYGLGNLFFDQADEFHSRAVIDRHVFYAGRYLSTELIPIVIEDAARPRPLTGSERDAFLAELFAASQWNPSGHVEP